MQAKLPLDSRRRLAELARGRATRTSSLVLSPPDAVTSPDDTTSFRWAIANVCAYSVGAVAAGMKAVGVGPDHGDVTFATFTNVSFLAPFVLLLTHERLGVFLPMLLYLSAFQAFGSLFHHAHGCRNGNLRVLDHIAILLLYTYMINRALWAVLSGRRRLRLLLRVSCVASIALVVAFYDRIVHHELAITFTAIIITAATLVIGHVHMQALPPTKKCTVAWDHVIHWMRSGTCTALLVTVAGTATIFESAHSIWADRFSYDLSHGIWHLLLAQAQFVLSYSLLTRAPNALEPSQMVLTLLVTSVLLILRIADADTIESLLGLFLVATTVAWALLMLQLRARQPPLSPLRWETNVVEPG